jgi:hypothetical protein
MAGNDRDGASSTTNANSCCASGEACKLKGVPIATTHVCRICKKPIHGGCGVEDPKATNIKFMEACLPCLGTDLEEKGSQQAPAKRKLTAPHDDQGPLAVKKPREASTSSRNNRPDQDELYSHFHKLDHKYTSPTDKEKKAQVHWACICKYCKTAYDSRNLQRPGTLPPCKPVELARYKKGCEAHLRKCSHYNKAKQMEMPKNFKRAGVPPVEPSIASSLSTISSASPAMSLNFTRMLSAI